MKLGKVACLAILAAAVGCKQKPPPDDAVHIQPRTDFSREDFGIGRPHTRNAACNREIDRLLDETRLCFNRRPGEGCDRLQQANSDRITRLKNSDRCQH